MSYAHIAKFEGLLADACLRHRIGNPYTNVVLTPDGQHRAQAYAKAVKMVRAYKASGSLEEIAQYQDLWSSCAKTITVASVLARVEEKAKAGDELAFTRVLDEVDWQSRTAEEFIRAIELALKVGAHFSARKLAAEGANLHFDSEQLQKYARVLAPPKIIATATSHDVNPSANIEWLKANESEYKGRWVALKNGELLGAAGSYKELRDHIGKTKGQGILITSIY